MVEDQIRRQLDKRFKSTDDTSPPDAQPATSASPSETATDRGNDTERVEGSTPLPAEDHLPRTATGASASATAAPSIGESSVRDSGVAEADSRGGVFTRTRQRTRREDGSDPAHQAAPLGVDASQTATHQVQAQPTDPEPNGPSGTGKLTLFYQSSMSSAYKKEEKAIRSIIHKNCNTNQSK